MENTKDLARDIVAKVQAELIVTCKSDLDRLMAHWEYLEKKAQAYLTISSVFVAATFGFIKDLEANMETSDKLFMLLVVVLLLKTIFFAVLVLKPHKIQSLCLSEYIFNNSKDFLSLGAVEMIERHQDFVNEFSLKITQLNAELSKISLEKGRHLMVTQHFLVASVFCVATYAFLLIWR